MVGIEKQWMQVLSGTWLKANCMRGKGVRERGVWQIEYSWNNVRNWRHLKVRHCSRKEILFQEWGMQTTAELLFPSIINWFFSSFPFYHHDIIPHVFLMYASLISHVLIKIDCQGCSSSCLCSSVCHLQNCTREASTKNSKKAAQ